MGAVPVAVLFLGPGARDRNSEKPNSGFGRCRTSVAEAGEPGVYRAVAKLHEDVAVLGPRYPGV